MAEQVARSAGDGRLRRSARSKQRIADALFELVGEGHLSPAAQLVADRAGIGIRTVFRHFEDMDALYATTSTRLDLEIAPILRLGPADGATLEERVEAMVEHRATLYERCSPYIRANHRLRDRSEFLAGRFRQLVLQLRELLLRWLPELHDASPELVEALDQSTSFEAWDRLRIDQQLSRARAQASMHFAASALVAQLDDSR